MDDQHKAVGVRIKSPPASLTERVRSLRLPSDLERNTARRSSRLPWLLCGVLATACAYLVYRNATLADASAAPQVVETPRSIADLPAAQAAPAGRTALEAGGYVIPVHRVQVSPKVGGEVIELFIEEGQYVKKGDLLARLDPEKYRFEYRRFEGMTEQAK